MNSSKSLFDMLPPPKSATNYEFKSKTAASSDDKPASAKPSSIVKPVVVQPPFKSKIISAPINPVKDETPYSSSTVISSKPVPNITKPAKSLPNPPKVQKINFFGIEAYDSDEDLSELGKIESHIAAYYEPSVPAPPKPQEPIVTADILKYENRKRRHDPGVINIVDVNIRDVIEKNKEQQLKNLTSEPVKPARKINCAGRKGSHINNLAQLAKEREQELSHQWADGKFNRKQSKQKYGF